ncbi:MAG TPA: hypothetical protein VK601_11525 [Kofleriaceae bacterium]|nr:hypothetical protein [Kofleriaceae bacterium]
MGRALATSPGAQLVVGAAVLALAFPAQASGALGLAILGGALGIALATAWPHAPDWLRAPPERTATAVVVAIVVIVGVAVFREVLTESPDWQMGDWGPQRAVLGHVMPALPGFDLPVWNHAVGTGDAPLELYPALGYLVTGYAALALGLGHDLPLALMIVAVIVHLTIAVATAALAMRIAPRPIAVAIGLATLVDSGAVAHGGTVGLFRWALLHSALALACSAIAALGVVEALRRPRLAASATIWLATAVATIAHPAGLIAAAATMVALAAVAVLAADVPPRRALAALGHVALGAALAAAVWMPLAARLLAYGQHFPNALRPPARLLEDLLAAPSPVTAFAALEYAGYAGLLAGLVSRRAVVVFIAASGFVLLLGLCDAPYLDLALAPGMGVARLGTERLAQLARPFVWAASGYGLAILVGHARAAWRGAGRRHQLIGAALLGVIGGALLRVAPDVWSSVSERASDEARVYAPDPIGRAGLTRWAAQRAREIGPGAWARALFEEDTHEHFHLTAETGLPSFHLAPQPDLLLRERIEDSSEPSLRRFNVRWVIGVGRSPSLGEPASEKTLGIYRIRELASWDGKFARIERGAGEVAVTRLDDRGVELEVTGTDQPVLVALGTGFYPRWRARHASGAAEPVYAYPTIPGGQLHVVAAWLAPGRTTFTVDGPLPSDHDGRAISALAALVIAAGAAVWSRRRWRHRALRRLASWRRRAAGRGLGRVVVRAGVPLALAVLLVRGCQGRGGATAALVLGSGVRSTAEVDARFAGGAWRRCAYLRVTGTHDCEGLVTAYDATANLLNDAPPSWGFVTPAILATAHAPGVEIRIRLRARLAGAYDAAVSEGEVELAAGGEPARKFERAQLVYADRGERDLEIRARVPMASWAFTLVRSDTLVPDRPFLDGPPDAAPAEVRAIGAAAPSQRR